MENFIGLIVIFVIWGIMSVMRKSARNQQALAKQRLSQNSPQAEALNRPAASTDEINRLLEMLTGTTNSPSQEPSIDYSVEANTEAGGYEESTPVYTSLDQYIPLTGTLDQITSEEDLQSVLTSTDSDMQIYHSVEKSVHPLLLDFDPRKALIYSEIFQPKFL